MASSSSSSSASIFAIFAAWGAGAAELEGEPSLQALGGEIEAVQEGREGEDGVNGDDEETDGLGQGEEDDEIEEMHPVDEDVRVVPHIDGGVCGLCCVVMREGMMRTSAYYALPAYSSLHGLAWHLPVALNVHAN
jgi:hypothetical protein